MRFEDRKGILCAFLVDLVKRAVQSNCSAGKPREASERTMGLQTGTLYGSIAEAQLPNGKAWKHDTFVLKNEKTDPFRAGFLETISVVTLGTDIHRNRGRNRLRNTDELRDGVVAGVGGPYRS
jgi:hypothetical protein